MSSLERVQDQVNELTADMKPKVSDGYHTFGELYEHRVTLFIALCNTIDLHNKAYKGNKKKPWKSLLHSDGTMWGGWFIAGIGNEPGKTITYHLPRSEWDNLDVDILEKAPEWDGHTSEDVLRLLKQI